MFKVNKSSGRYFWDYERVWSEAGQSGVAPSYIGDWGGRLALSAEPTKPMVKGLCDGDHLARRQQNRVGCFDLTLTFSKSVSFLAYGLTPPNQWNQWTQTFARVSVPEVKALVENQLANSGAQGKTKEPSRGGAMGFNHWQSYLGTPHAHTHFAVPNLTCTRDGKVGSIANADVMYKHQDLINARINKALDDRLQDLGFATVRVGRNVELASVPKELIKEISLAREAMDEARREKGFSGPRAEDFYARQARRDAGPRVEKTPDEMHRDCKALADRYGVTVESLKRDPAIPAPSKDQVTSMSVAYDVAIETRDACAKTYVSFTAEQFKERLYTLGIGRATTSQALDTIGTLVLENPKFAGVTREAKADDASRHSTNQSKASEAKENSQFKENLKSTDNTRESKAEDTFRYSTKESKAIEAKIERQFVREAWDELGAATKELGKAVLIATAKKAAEVITRIAEALDPEPKVILVDARKLAAFNREHRPTNYLIAHAKALGTGLCSPGNPHDRAGVAEKVFAQLRRCEHLPRNSIVIVDRSALADLRQLSRLGKIALRDGASVILTERPEHLASRAKPNHHGHDHERSH